MSVIFKTIATWVLVFLGSLLLPFVSLAAVSGTTYEIPCVDTTLPATTTDHTTTTGTTQQNIASNQAQAISGLSLLLLAPKTTPKFDVHPRVLNQLSDKRLGNLSGKLTPDDLQTLINNPSAQRVRDLRPNNFGNINVIQTVDDKLLRITVPGDEFKIIFVGPIRPNQVNNLINNGGFAPIP